MAKKSAKSGAKKTKTKAPQKSVKKAEQKQETSKPQEKVKKSQSNSQVKRIGDGLFDVHHLTKLVPVVLILFVMWFAFFIRAGPIDLDGLDDRMIDNTYAQIKNIISQQVDAQYPNLNPVYKQERVDQEYQKVLNTGIFEMQGQSIVIADFARQNAASIKEAFQADNGQTYLNAIDPHHFYKLSENILKNGHQGDGVRYSEARGEEVPYASYKLSPEGSDLSWDPQFHVWLGAKMMQWQGLDADSPIGEKTEAIYLIPVIFAVLSVIPVYLIIRKFSNDLYAFMGSIFLVSISTFVSRTVAGFVDTDAYNVFFPLLIAVFLVYGLLSTNRYMKYILIALAGFAQGLYLWAWAQGWFIFVFAALAIFGDIIYRLILAGLQKFKTKSTISILKNRAISLGLFLFSSYVFVHIFANVNIFSKSISVITGGLSGVTSISASNIWPNVLSSVAELNPASFIGSSTSIVSTVGGALVFFFGMIGLVMLSIDFKPKNDKIRFFKILLVLISIVWFVMILGAKLFIGLTANLTLLFIVLLFLPVAGGIVLSLMNAEEKSSKIFILMMLSVWIAGTIYMSLYGVRFILLLAPAFTIAFALGLFYTGNIINNFFAKEFEIKQHIWKYVWGSAVTLILFIVFFIPLYQNAMYISKGTTPNFDDAWYDSMIKIKENSNEDAIITSWWDFGHFFAMVSQRGVTFDGGLQTKPQSHWVGKLLMENNEEVSRDILKMLVCGGNQAFAYMLEESQDETGGILVNKIIYKTFGKSTEEKKAVLQTNKYFQFNEEQINVIMEKLSCVSPPQNFLITSEDMVGKAGVWAHWGSWDFTKKYVYDNYKIKTVSQIAQTIDEEEALIEQYVKELNEIDVTAEVKGIKKMNLVNQWFAPYPGFIPLSGKYFYNCQQTNTSLVCQNGITLNLITGEVQSGLNADIKFRRAILPNQDGELGELPIDSQGDFDLVFVPGSSNYQVMLAQYPLGNSLFAKLFYYDGQFSNNYFEKFDDVNSVTGVQVKVWKVDFNKTKEEFIPEIEISNMQFDVEESQNSSSASENISIES